MDINNMIRLLTAIWLTPGGSSTVHIYIQTIHRTTHVTTHRAIQLTINWEECRPCPVSASCTLAFALQLRKKHGKTCQGTVYIIPTHSYITKPTHTHTLQNNIKPPQYKLRQTQCKIYLMI